MATKNQDGTLSIEAWSLVEFLPEVIKAHEEGYVLDMDKNLGYPQSFGSLITITMFPKPGVEKPVVEDTTPVEVKTEEVVPEVTTIAPAQRGRPKSK